MKGKTKPKTAPKPTHPWVDICAAGYKAARASLTVSQYAELGRFEECPEGLMDAAEREAERFLGLIRASNATRKGGNP